MPNSVLTNSSAMVALQSLNRTNEQLAVTQNRVNTGLKVQGAKDNASIWAIAQNQRADLGSLDAVKTSLNRATSIADISLTAGEQISDILIQMKAMATAAAAPTGAITEASRKAYDDDYQSALSSLTSFAENATFDGSNILDGTTTPTAGLSFLASADGTETITLDRQDFSLATLNLDGTDLTGADNTNPAAALAAIDAALAQVTSGLSKLGAQAKQIENHTIFVTKMMDGLEAGIGNLVDADLAKESARLQALQVQQQLGAQALSIANQSPQIILSLFQS